MIVLSKSPKGPWSFSNRRIEKKRLLRNSEKCSKAKITFKNVRQILPLKRTFFINNNCPFPKHLFHWNSVHMKENIIFWVKIFLPAPHLSYLGVSGKTYSEEKPKWKTYLLPFLSTQIYPNRQNYSGHYFTTFSWLGRSVKQKKGNPTSCYTKICHGLH